MNDSPSIVSLQVDRDGIALVQMRDEVHKNTFTHAFTAQLNECLEQLADPQIKVCVLCGLEEVFCAGGNLDLLLDLAEGRVKPYDLRLTQVLMGAPVPTIAAMAGAAVGGGLMLGLCCDVVVLARESRYGCNFLDLGITPGMGSTALLKAAMGEYLAAEMLFGGQYFRGTQLQGRSQVNYIAPRSQVEEQAVKVARRFCDKERCHLELLKRTLSLPRRRALEEALTLEALMHEVCFAAPETRQRIEENYLAIVVDKGERNAD